MNDLAALFAEHESALRVHLTALLRKWPKVAAATTVDDLAQEVMLNVVEGWEGFRGDASFKTWLFRFADNVVTSAAREQSPKTKAGKEKKLRIVYDSDKFDAVVEGQHGAKTPPDRRPQIPAGSDPESEAIDREDEEEKVAARKFGSGMNPSVGAELTSVPLSSEAGPLIGALMLLATVAYPEDWAKRDRAMLAMQAVRYRQARLAGHLHLQGAAESLKAFPTQQMHGTMRKLSHRLGQRLHGAEVAGLLSIGLRRNGAPLTLGDFADPTGRFMSDAWAPEVMHLAMALRRVIIDRGDPTLPALIADTNWAPDALRHAERMLPTLAALGVLRPALKGLKPARFIRLIPE